MDKQKLILAVGAGIVGGITGGLLGGFIGAGIKLRGEENTFDRRVDGINSQRRLIKNFCDWLLANTDRWSFEDQEIHDLFIENLQFISIADAMNKDKAEGRGYMP